MDNMSTHDETIAIVDADVPELVETVRALFVEYATSLGFSLCFQNFDKELDGLPGSYARPEGRLLLARVDDLAAGCVGLRPLSSSVCEMKRLYVRPAMRGRGLGRALAEAVITQARAARYRTMRLDTVEPLMSQAVALYRAIGFREIAPYTANSLPGALYMALEL